MDLFLPNLKIKNAIIIHGPGRSGTTLLSNILSLHSGFYWISGYNNKFPSLPSLSIFNNLLKYHSFEKYTRGKQKFPRPAEAYGFWNYYIPNFNDPDLIFTDLQADWTLASAAPALNVGTALSYFNLTSVDLSGTVRADPPDMGCFEFVSVGYGNKIIKTVF